jgi:hypothetical protein
MSNANAVLTVFESLLDMAAANILKCGGIFSAAKAKNYESGALR